MNGCRDHLALVLSSHPDPKRKVKVTMAVDEELLKPSREHLAMLGAEIKRQEALAASDIERYGYGDPEYSRQRRSEFHMTAEPIRREREAVAKVIADYYAAQPLPQIVIPTMPNHYPTTPTDDKIPS